jgi:hypothetical protein
MIDREAVLRCIEDPMEQYREEAKATIGNWKPLVDVSEKLLAGEEVHDGEVPSIFLPIVRMMKLIMDVTRESEWDWSDPAIQNAYKDLAASQLYNMFADATFGIVSSIIKTVEIGTLLEVGTGPGQIVTSLCREMTEHSVSVPVIISDRSPTVSRVGESLREAFPNLSVHDFVWDIKEAPPGELVEKLTKPVLIFERFCILYGGYGAIDRIGPIADILIIAEDLNLTGQKEAYDVIYEKIGSQFLTYAETKRYLEKHFSFIHTCDRKAIDSINAPVTDFTLAIK